MLAADVEAPVQACETGAPTRRPRPLRRRAGGGYRRRYAKVSSPESIRFPHGRKTGGILTLLVQGAHAPLMQHLAPLIIERVNRFFGYEAVAKVGYRQGTPLPQPAAPKRPELRPVPREIGEGLREIADPELRACLESLAASLSASNGPPEIEPSKSDPIPLSGVKAK
jgi:hypothetical protein